MFSLLKFFMDIIVKIGFFLQLSICIVDVVYNQEIKFQPIKQGDFETKCESGFVKFDTIVIQSIANFSQFPSNYKMVYATYGMQTSQERTYKRLFSIDLYHPCDKESTIFYCENIEQNVVKVVLRLKADPRYSNAKIQSRLQINSLYVSSDIMDVPEIQDIQNISGQIIINGKNYTTDECDAVVSLEEDFSFEFHCTSPVKPCLIEIIQNEFMEPIIFNNVAVFNASFKKVSIIPIFIKYGACILEKDYYNVSCVIQTDHRKMTFNFPTIVIVSVCLVFLITTVILLLRKKWYSLIKKCFSGKKQESLSMIETSDENELKDLFGARGSYKKVSTFDDHDEMRIIKEVVNLKKVDLFDVSRNFPFQESETFEDIEKKENLTYGAHEIQISEEGEDALARHFSSCKKNPDHKNFITVNDFTINNLPEGYRDDEMVNLIKSTADLTVRVAVKMTSTSRPKFWPNSGVPYAFYNRKGLNVLRLGTGIVRNVNAYTESEIRKYDMGLCKCDKCNISSTPSPSWGEVWIDTATRLVYDDVESRHTTCRFFYDTECSPFVFLSNWKVVEAIIEDDRCELKTITCDLNLLNKLDKLLRVWFDLRVKVYNKYWPSRNVHRFNFLVSHPHGCSKLISVGQWIDRVVMKKGSGEDKFTRYTYTTSTCPGSSGAYVQSIGYDDDWLYDRHVHSGVNYKGLNFSGTGRDSN